ncbi:MAG TPA: phosphatidate cytidylyltransferase [Chthoniobacterales bacterium]|nr:phosphatidate cytidylyltransferase [Chthoniobacterales bacterium]
MSRFSRRLISATAMWIIALSIIFSGNEILFLLLIGSLGMAGLWEYFGMLEQSGTRCFTAFGLVCGAASFIGSFLALRTGSQTAAYDFDNFVLLIFLFGVIARQMFRPTVKSAPLEAMAYTLFGLLYVAWLFNFLTKIVYAIPRNPQGGTVGQYYVLYLVVVTKFADMGAYLVGSRIGRHQMMPHISPSKTWEGFFGSLLFSIAASCLLIFIMPKTLVWLNFFHGTILGLLIGVAAVIGDLGESIIKRSTGVKDSGVLLPGIGGMLDLIDSLLFTAPILFFYLRFLVR